MKRYSKWIICGLLFLATLINYIDRQTISVLSTKIADEMRLNDSDLGKLFFGFMFTYGLAQMFVGPVLDRFRVVAAYAVAVTAWSLAGAASALSVGFLSLFLARMLLGVCESPNWPLALRVVARVFPANQRSLAIGIFQNGLSVSALVAPPVIIWLTQTWNWRAAFAVCGAIGLLWVAAWTGWFRLTSNGLLNRSPEDEQAGADPSTHAAGPSGVAEILRSRAFWGLALATVFINPLEYFYITWLPRYFDKYAGVGFGKELAARLVIAYFALDIGFFAGGAVASLLAARMGAARGRLAMSVLGTLCMATIPAATRLHDLDAITALICVATFGSGVCVVNYLAFVSEVSPRKISTAAGLLGGLGSLAGGGFMLLIGGAIEQSHSFRTAFLMTGVMPFAGLLGLWLCARELRRDGAPEAAAPLPTEP
ncbi:MAG TPA: MFS transporter [Opitutaceae bacterium]|nr:MFS transporter [Opitutaceae bacterium]